MAKMDEQKQGEVTWIEGVNNRGQQRKPTNSFQKYKGALSRLEEPEREEMEFHRSTILTAIEKTTRNSNCEQLECWEEVKEAYSYELALQGMGYMLSVKPLQGRVFKWASILTSIRKSSWSARGLRQKDCIAAAAQPLIIELDEEGEIVDVGHSASGWQPPFNPPNEYRVNPEEFLIQLESYELVRQLPARVGSLPARRAGDHRVIMEAELDGVKVTSKNAREFGIEPKEAAALGNQARRRVKDIVAEMDEEAAEKQRVYEAQKAKKWKVKRSTFAERRRLHRREDPQGVISTRRLSVKEGGKHRLPAPNVGGVHVRPGEDEAA